MSTIEQIAARLLIKRDNMKSNAGDNDDIDAPELLKEICGGKQIEFDLTYGGTLPLAANTGQCVELKFGNLIMRSVVDSIDAETDDEGNLVVSVKFNTMVKTKYLDGQPE